MASPPDNPRDNRIALSWATEFAAYKPEQACTAWSVATLKAPFYDPTARAPIDVCAVIANSASKAEDFPRHRGAIDLVREALQFIIEQLNECDRLALVTYDTKVHTKFHLTNMTEKNKKKALKKVKKVQQWCSRDLCGGLIRGMQEIAGRGKNKAKVSSVLLLAGMYDSTRGERASVDAIQQEMKKIPNFDGTIYTFGFGPYHDARKLEALATEGGGVYYYIDSAYKIPDSFADCLGGLLSVTGQNISLKLEAQGSNSITEVHTSKAVTWKTKSKCCEVAMGDLQSEEQRDVVLEIQLPVLPAPITDTVVTATLSYFNVITSSVDTVLTELKLERTAADRGRCSLILDRQRNRILATAALTTARDNFISFVLDDAISTITSSASAKDDFCQALMEDMRRSVEEIQPYIERKTDGVWYLNSSAHRHSAQRSNYIGEASSYQSSIKASLVGISQARKR